MQKICLPLNLAASIAVSFSGLSVYGEPNKKPAKLADGFYLILKASEQANTQKPASAKQRVMVYDYKFLKKKGDRRPRYLLVRTTPDVLLILAESPRKVKEPGGQTSLGLTLKSQYAGQLLRFTRKHKDREVAFIIGDEVITAHRVREAIGGGKILVSRCHDNACE